MALGPEGGAVPAALYSYGMQPQLPLGTSNRPVWWTKDRVASTVTMEFVSSKLRDDERAHLHRPLNFGDGLTNDTYLEYILDRAKTLFLILSEIGAANRIFSIIDRSYDDGDLPIPEDIVGDLALSPKGDDKLDKKFSMKQFDYLLRELEQGSHIEYVSAESVPMEYSYRQPTAQSLEHWIRVRIPKLPKSLLARRSVAMERLDIGEGFPSDYYDDIDTMKSIEHEHIASIWASYTYRGAAYILTPFVAEHTLKSFLDNQKGSSYLQLSKNARQRLLLEWMHCLADAVAYLHLNGFQHTAIRPSNIVIDHKSNIAFSDIGCLKSFQRDKKIDATEVYNYGAPEAHLGERYVFMNSPGPKSVGTLLFRKRSHESKSSTSEDSLDGSYDRGSLKPFGLRKVHTLSSAFNFSALNGSLARIESPAPPTDSHSLHSQSSQILTEKTDIFSLGCIFLELLSFLHKFKPNDLTKHIRSVRKAQKGFYSARFDSSYHANIPRINTWMNILDDKAFEYNDKIFRSVPYLIRLIRAMLSHDSDQRPTAAGVRDHIHSILTHYGDIDSKDLHCGNSSHGWDDRAERASYSTFPSSITLGSLSGSDATSFVTPSSRDTNGYQHGIPKEVYIPSSSSSETASIGHPWVIPSSEIKSSRPPPPTSAPTPRSPRDSKSSAPNFSRHILSVSMYSAPSF